MACSVECLDGSVECFDGRVECLERRVECFECSVECLDVRVELTSNWPVNIRPPSSADFRFSSFNLIL